MQTTWHDKQGCTMKIFTGEGKNFSRSSDSPLVGPLCAKSIPNFDPDSKRKSGRGMQKCRKIRPTSGCKKIKLVDGGG